MAPRHEDFDEFCDPENPRELQYDEVMEAADRIRPFISNTPLIESKYQEQFVIKLMYKLELRQVTGSFKERGAVNALQLLPLDKKKIGIVIASVGNFAISLCHHASKLNVPVTVVMPLTVPVAKLQKCHSYGAKVFVQGNNLLEAQKVARLIAREKGLTYINRDHPHILAGYGSLAVEILEQSPLVDAIIVPVGTGGLAAAITTVAKHLKPECLVYGVQSEKMPVLFKSLENGEPLIVPMGETQADAIAVPTAGVNAFSMLHHALDKVLLVKEDWISKAVLHLAEKERYVVEGAGACPLAAIIGNLVPELKTKNVVCVLTGGNIDSILLVRCMERGLAAEGRLIKFRVGMRDTAAANTQLMQMLADAGYNVVTQMRHREWLDEDVYNVEMVLVCETNGLEHALDLKKMIERAYPCASAFETEPFNDKRTCPCYVRKTIC